MAAAEIGGRLRLRGSSMFRPMASVARTGRCGGGGEGVEAVVCDDGETAAKPRHGVSVDRAIGGGGRRGVVADVAGGGGGRDEVGACAAAGGDRAG